MADTPRPTPPAPTIRPAGPSAAPSPSIPAPSIPEKGPAGTPAGTPAQEARRPDEYLEAPGSHRRPDGAATDVGA